MPVGLLSALPATLLLAASTATAADAPYPSVVEDLSGGRIDWTELRLEVTSISNRTVGAWKDRRVQEQDAVDRLSPRVTALAEEVRVTPDRDAGDLLDGDPELGRRLERSLSDWRVEETRYHAAGGVEMDAVLDLQAWLRPALGALAAPGEPPAPPPGTTGLVIDARGLPFSPCLAPTVVAADGTVVMRAQMLTQGALIQRSPALYVSDPADPRAASRAGSAPVFARAGAIQNGALVLAAGGPSDTAPGLADLVAAGRVVIVTDAP